MVGRKGAAALSNKFVAFYRDPAATVGLEVPLFPPEPAAAADDPAAPAVLLVDFANRLLAVRTRRQCAAACVLGNRAGRVSAVGGGNACLLQRHVADV